MSESFQDRRKHVRVYRNFILSYYLMNKQEQKFEVSQINNISRGGVNFIAMYPFKIGDELGMELSTPYLTDAVHLQGFVLDSKEKIPNLIFEIRLQFENVSPQAEDILKKIEEYATKES